MNKKSFSLLLLSLWIFNCQTGKTESNTVIGQQETVKPESSNQLVANPVDTVVYEYASFEEGLQLFQELNYTPEAWLSGVREIPNLRLMQIPQRWRASTSQQLEVKMKKQLFFRIVGPLALVINDDVAKDRDTLDELTEKGLMNLTADEREWLSQIAITYKVTKADDTVNVDHLKELRIRVDEIPLSLVLAQSAEESGWGTSRFAAEGNALFGQWAWGAKAMKPEQQRAGLGNYGIARFDSPLESMRAYMLNLNTHNAYRKLREVRAEMRSLGKQPNGPSLAQTLTKYSERGQGYVETLLSIMRVNRLIQADSAYLKKDPVILMVPLE